MYVYITHTYKSTYINIFYNTRRLVLCVICGDARSMRSLRSIRHMTQYILCTICNVQSITHSMYMCVYMHIIYTYICIYVL